MRIMLVVTLALASCGPRTEWRYMARTLPKGKWHSTKYRPDTSWHERALTLSMEDGSTVVLPPPYEVIEWQQQIGD